MPVPDPRLLARYVDAFERLDLDALVALLREDVTLAMPPYELWLHGRDDVVQWLLAQDHRRHRYRPTAANGSLAVAHYAPAGPDGAARPIGIHVLDVSGAHIAGIHVFLDPKLFTVFQVPLDR